MFLIGIMGAKGAGKDTVADALCELHGATKMSMAAPLKAMLVTLGIPAEDLEDRTKKEEPHLALCGKTIRWAAQSLGTEWGRNLISPDVWVTAMEKRISDHWRVDHSPVVIPDIRFPNEVDLIRRNSGLIIRVRRAEAEPDMSSNATWLRRLRLKKNLHPSEIHWMTTEPDIELINSGSVEDLRQQAASATYQLIRNKAPSFVPEAAE